MSGESESSDSDGSKIITSDEEEEFLEEITSTEIEMRGENVQYHTCRICLENYPLISLVHVIVVGLYSTYIKPV